MAKLTDRQKNLLIADYHTNKYSQRELSKKYNISVGTVNNLTKEITPKNEHLDARGFVKKYGAENIILSKLIEEIKNEAALIDDIVCDIQKSYKLIIRKKIESHDENIQYVLSNIKLSEIELIAIINAVEDFSTRIGHTAGEQKIKDFLLINKISHKSEYIFENLPKKRFDFYIESKKICIEFDGKQHFEPIDFFGGLEAFKKTQENDNIKNLFCQNNKIKLIRISYKEYDDIESTLKEVFYGNK